MEKEKLTVPEQLMHSTVRIECEDKNGNRSTGTGYFFRFQEKGKSHIPAIVTNKHVIKDSIKGYFHLTQSVDGNPEIGNHYEVFFEVFETLWINHPDDDVDLAIFPIANVIKQTKKYGKEFFYVNLENALIPTKDDLDELSGNDEVIMVGYPNGLWDSKNNLPIFRSGKTATHPRYDYEDKPYFLIDCACFPGSSGSPVFIYNPHGWRKRDGNIEIGQIRLLFLGTLFAGPQHPIEGVVETIEIPNLANQQRSYSRIPNNLGFVVKSTKLIEFEPILEKLQQENLKNQDD